MSVHELSKCLTSRSTLSRVQPTHCLLQQMQYSNYDRKFTTVTVTKACITTQQLSFNCIRQVWPISTPSNTWFFGTMQVCPQDWIEQGLTSHQTHYRSYRGRVFTGQMTQPTVSKHWRKKVCPQMAARLVQLFLRSSWSWPMHRQTDRHTHHATCNICGTSMQAKTQTKSRYFLCQWLYRIRKTTLCPKKYTTQPSTMPLKGGLISHLTCLVYVPYLGKL